MAKLVFLLAFVSLHGFISETRINSWNINSNFYLTLKKDINEHLRVVLMLGNDIFEHDYEMVNATGENFVFPDFYDLSYTSQISNSQDKRKKA